MRLWTLHPRYLDRQGLLAVWREGLLAQAVIRGNTKGYRNHPQLIRFQQHPNPRRAIAYYLSEVYEESILRNHNFDASKFELSKRPQPIPATSGQMEYEFSHLLAKLEKRSPEEFKRLSHLSTIDPHPLFHITPGDIETWEKVGTNPRKPINQIWRTR